MDLKIPYASVTDKKLAYDAAKKVIPEAISKFGVKADVKLNDSDTSLSAKGTGFEVSVRFEDKHVEVKMDLSFLLKPMKGKILEVLEKQIKKVV